MEEKGVVEGNLLLVMWENHADPIITGREQLGYSKIFASIDDIHTYGGVSKTELTSWGFRFLELEFDANRQPENLEELISALWNSQKRRGSGVDTQRTHKTEISRLDEVQAARNPKLHYEL